jgi:hypothetical protein
VTTVVILQKHMENIMLVLQKGLWKLCGENVNDIFKDTIHTLLLRRRKWREEIKRKQDDE